MTLLHCAMAIILLLQASAAFGKDRAARLPEELFLPAGTAILLPSSQSLLGWLRRASPCFSQWGMM